MTFWIIPSNPEQFDVNGCIDKHRIVYWRQTKYHYNVGDVIFIYTTGGVGKIQYAMMVEQAAKTIRPKVLFPYHYGKTDIQQVVKLLDGSGIDVRIRQYQ